MDGTKEKEESPSNSSINSFWEEKYYKEASKNWNLFYKRNETRFFKDRHWISNELPELFCPNVNRILEVGCGVGNFALPLLEVHPGAEIFACDFAPRAIELLQQDRRYVAAAGRCTAFVADLTAGNLPENIPPLSVDVVTCIFVFSAIPHQKFSSAVENIKSILRPGGLVVFRDYSVEDAALKRFKKDRKISNTLFVRQDGTLAYYFSKEEVINMFTDHGFTLDTIDIINSKTTNIKKEVNVDRFFIQAKFRL